MSLEGLSLRQSVSANAHACDTRFGVDVIDRFGKDLRLSVGRPRNVVIVHREGCDAELVESVRRQMTDSGFLVTFVVVPDDMRIRDCESVPWFYKRLAEAGITGDDAVVPVGGTDLVSAVAVMAAGWGSGMAVGAVATDMATLLACPATPLRLDAYGLEEMVGARTRMSLCYTTPDIVAKVDDHELVNAYLVQSATCESVDAFKTLVTASEAVASGDLEATAKAVLDAARGRGRIVSSTSAAVRQSIAYGMTLGRALMALLGMDRAHAMSEGMRFASRVAAGMEMCDVDFVYTQDGLLDRLGLEEVAFDLDAGLLVKTMRDGLLARGNKVLFLLPYAAGRVRPTGVDDELLSEFTAAFCESRRRLL